VKKKIPLQVLETIEPYVNKKGETFHSSDPQKFLLKFDDKEDGSDFYFNVESYKNDQGFQLLIDWKPINKQSVANKKMWIKAESLDNYFTNWLKLLEGYDKVRTVFDDPIIEAFTEEYFSEFEIIDEDADTKPFKTNQVLLLDKHLSTIHKKIEKHKTEDNQSEIEAIQSDVLDLKSNLTRKSKKWVIQRLSKIWAKITKQGPHLMKEFLSETKKQAIKEGVKLIIEKGTDFIT
jgi:hypothetical protein